MSFGFNVGFVGTASPQHPERVRIAVATQFTCGPVLAPINPLDICFWWLFVSFSQREYIQPNFDFQFKTVLNGFHHNNSPQVIGRATFESGQAYRQGMQAIEVEFVEQGAR